MAPVSLLPASCVYYLWLGGAMAPRRTQRSLLQNLPHSLPTSQLLRTVPSLALGLPVFVGGEYFSIFLSRQEKAST